MLRDIGCKGEMACKATEVGRQISTGKWLRTLKPLRLLSASVVSVVVQRNAIAKQFVSIEKYIQ